MIKDAHRDLSGKFRSYHQRPSRYPQEGDPPLRLRLRAVLKNADKRAMFSVEERLEMLKESTQGMRGVVCETFDGLAVWYASARGAIAMVRGLRAVSDFEAEFKMATANNQLDPTVEMVYLMTSNEFAFLSSSIVREVASMGGPVDPWVPQCVARRLRRDSSIKRGLSPDESHESRHPVGPPRSTDRIGDGDPFDGKEPRRHRGSVGVDR